MIEKIEDFLFDIMGLLIPGLIFIFMLIMLPVSFVDLDKIRGDLYLKDKTLVTHIFLLIYKKFNTEYLTSFYTIFFIILTCYILGHAIKVFSKYQYDLLSNLFDRGINIFIRFIILQLKKCKYLILLDKGYRDEFKKREDWYVGLVNIPVGLVLFICKLIKDIFTFSSSAYYIDNKSLQSDVVRKINLKYNAKFPDKWYSIYKLSGVIMAQEKLKSLSSKFLAKYNFYRSMAFLFLLNNFYTIIFYYKYKDILSEFGKSIIPLIVVFNMVLWLTFHEKYKRYWTLCGNEALMSLFYFLSKPISVKEEVQNE